jgi:hypothetical protein
MSDEQRSVAGKRLRYRRGLFRLWIFSTVVWLAVAGGAGVLSWSDELRQIGRDMMASITPDPSEADFERLCAKLRRQTAAGGPVDKIAVVPRLEVVVTDGVAKVVAAPGLCVADLAKEAGVDLIAVAVKRVGGDSSRIRELEDISGQRRPYDDFAHANDWGNEPLGYDYSAVGQYFAFVLAAPIIVLCLGAGAWWVAMGFRPR